jgi:hypothetical protein
VQYLECKFEVYLIEQHLYISIFYKIMIFNFDDQYRVTVVAIKSVKIAFQLFV